MLEKFVIGIVGAPFGVKGFVKVRSCSGEIEHLLKLKSVTINIEGKERSLKIEESESFAGGTSSRNASFVLMRFEGINSPEAAKTLSGAQLLAGRDQAAPLEDGEFYIEDLKGIQVFSDKNETIGHVADIIEGGGGELVEIVLINGEKRLVPFRKEFFTEISINNGKIILTNLWILGDDL